MELTGPLTFKNESSYLGIQNTILVKKAIKDTSKIFLLINIIKIVDFPIAELDVTASGFQIFSGLIEDLDGLYLTNFFVLKDKKTSKEDIYSTFMNHFLYDYDNYFNLNKIKKL